MERIAEANGWQITWLADEGVSGACARIAYCGSRQRLALLDAGESEALIFETNLLVVKVAEELEKRRSRKSARS